MNRLLLGAILLMASLAADISYAQFRCCRPCVTTYVTERNFHAGNDQHDLQVRIVGRKQSTVEAYFNNQFARFRLPTGDAILCPSVVFAKPSEEGYHGTFAIRYYTGGLHGLALCGWKKTTLKKLYPGDTIKDGDGNDVSFDVDQSRHFRLEWITNQICRIQHGPNRSLLTIVRFDSGADHPWRLVYAGSVAEE